MSAAGGSISPECCGPEASALSAAGRKFARRSWAFFMVFWKIVPFSLENVQDYVNYPGHLGVFSTISGHLHPCLSKNRGTDILKRLKNAHFLIQ